MRNEDFLSAQAPLLVNMPSDDFAKHLQTINPSCQLSFFDNNFAQHRAHLSLANDDADCQFSHYYQSEKIHDLVIIYFPKSKQELRYTLAMINRNITPDSRVLIVGENNGGIKSLAKQAKSLLNYCEKIDAARHCILFDVSLKNTDTSFSVDDWFTFYPLDIGNTSITVAALPGVFSQNKLDIGTKVLLNHLPDDLSGSCLDFGCGAGVIATLLAKKYQDVTVSLTDVSAMALASAKKTLALNHLSGDVFATDSLSHIDKTYQHVVSNPPFHQGIKTNYQATEQFLSGIHHHIATNGSLLLVANSFLQYRPLMENHFKAIESICQQNGFTVYRAHK